MQTDLQTNPAAQHGTGHHKADYRMRRKVVPDPYTKYFGAVLDKDGLAPTGKFIPGPTRFADWARASS